MIYRFMACALGLACALAILFLVVFESRGADFNKDWLFEDLTCAELVAGYFTSTEMLTEVLRIHNECLEFIHSPADDGNGALACALIKKEGLFLQGMANDMVGVFEAKHCRDKRK